MTFGGEGLRRLRPQLEPAPLAPRGLRSLSNTQILIATNVLIFLAMLFHTIWLSGAQQFLDTRIGTDFDDKVLFLWGSDYAPLTLGGQYWRVLTCLFVAKSPSAPNQLSPVAILPDFDFRNKTRLSLEETLSYRLPHAPAANLGGSRAITSLRVKSIITEPADGARFLRGPNTVRGLAWAGEAQVAKVEVSTDSGVTWHPAQLEDSRAKYAWRSWSYQWTTSGEEKYAIQVRATDDLGKTQSERPSWNTRGYMWNGIDNVTVIIGPLLSETGDI